jgi:LacI family transcriptional regulator
MPSNSRITISDVAEAAKVSKMTVSRVINGQPGVSLTTRQRILETIDALGFVANPAARTLRGISRVLGLILPGITSPYMGEVLHGVTTAAESLDYSLMLYAQGLAKKDHPGRTKYYASMLSKGLIAGAVMVVPYDYEVLVDIFKEYDVPYAIIDHHSETENEIAITATNRKGVIDAMRHLLALGHTRIGFITGRMSMGCAKDRLQGYKDALTEVGLPYEPELIFEGDFEQQTGFVQGQRILQMERPPTAIVASNDMMALGVMDAIKDAGLYVGRDISVVGFDDILIAAQAYPPLTTVRQPMAKMGEEAVNVLVSLLEGRKLIANQRELPTELIIRHSTARVGERRELINR